MKNVCAGAKSIVFRTSTHLRISFIQNKSRYLGLVLVLTNSPHPQIIIYKLACPSPSEMPNYKQHDSVKENMGIRENSRLRRLPGCVSQATGNIIYNFEVLLQFDARLPPEVTASN